MKFSEKVAGKLNELLEKNHDAEKSYKFAAEKVDDSKLQEFFVAQGNERYDFRKEINSEIRKYGESPNEAISIEGDIHRAWMNLKASLSSNTEEALLEETIRGEKTAVAEYEEVIKDTDIPPTTANMLLKQKNRIVASLNKVKSLELQD